MSNQLRKGLDVLRKYYITKILHADINSTTEQDLDTLTLSELQVIYKKLCISFDDSTEKRL